jgi:serine/threonine protein phosphatase 1
MSDGVELGQAAAPENMLIYAIGDVHGRLDLLRAMHKRIADEIEQERPADWRIVHLGDYVDRGPNSRGVIHRLATMQAYDERIVTLAGNHDICFIEFLQDVRQSGMFKHYGGIDTARSYGVEFADGDREFARNHERLVEAMPPEHIAFFLSLRYSLELGDFFFCHAGIRPGVPLDDQSLDDLVWIRGEFLASRALHPKVIVHGHTPVPVPELLANRINVDTGAFKTGILSAVRIEGRDVRVLDVRE